MYYKKNPITTIVLFLGIATTIAAMENNKEYALASTTIYTYPNGIKYTGVIYRKDGRPCDANGQFLVEYQVQKHPSRKKQHVISTDNPKYKKLASRLKTVTYYHDEFQKLHKATTTRKLGQERSAEETKYFNTLVEEMNNPHLNNTDFLIQTIFYGTKTSIIGNNETLENGIRDRLAQTKTSLAVALQKLQKGEELSPTTEKKLCDSSK